MTDFMERLQGKLQEKEAETKLRPSEITKMSLAFITDELVIRQKQFWKRLDKVSDKAREKMLGFAEEMRISNEKIVFILQAVQELTTLVELQGGQKVRDIAKMLRRRSECHRHKTKILQKQYPQTKQTEKQQQKQQEMPQTLQKSPSLATYVVKCHTAHSLEPCTPDNDLRLDSEIKKSLNQLFSSLERSLFNFQTSFSHEADEATNELVALMKGEYKRAKEKLKEQECPTLEQIQTIKQLELMVRATLHEKASEIRERQRKILSSFQSQIYRP